MRIRRSVRRFFGALVLPAICGAVTVYFGYHAIWGERGARALEDTQARLGIEQERLAEVRGARLRLQHRIELLKPGAVDLDLLEELSHSELMDAAPGEVAVPRPVP